MQHAEGKVWCGERIFSIFILHLAIFISELFQLGEIRINSNGKTELFADHEKGKP